MSWQKSFPVLIVDDQLRQDTAAGRATRELVRHLRDDRLDVIESRTVADGQAILAANPAIGCLLVDWDVHRVGRDADSHVGHQRLVEFARSHQPRLPIFLLADRSDAEDVPADVLSKVDGYIWKLEDTPDFIAGRVEEAVEEYTAPLLPPFFGRLVEFVDERKYSWHTPGHSGGNAFLKSPVGRVFHSFFGEHTLRSDLSVSVPELGSLLEHTGPIGAAEREAAAAFGADTSYFVTNGTSTANKIVFHAVVTAGEPVLVDRNCHKSVMHALTMTRAVPVYLLPTRNAYGIIGPIPRRQLSTTEIAAALAVNPLVADGKPPLAVVTNSTYDGICYDAVEAASLLGQSTDRVLFDEAWYAYAHFHPLYAGRYGMGVPASVDGVAIFATQSTHKLLAAFSQASMIHLRDGRVEIDRERFNEAFMMHASTSPQYGIIASLDVATRMMAKPQGAALIEAPLEEAINFRKEIRRLELASKRDDWSFRGWQPEVVRLADGTTRDFSETPSEILCRDPNAWTLKAEDAWHGFREVDDGFTMLDPLKVTLLTPGVSADGELQAAGVPAAVVARFLNERGIVVEKTSFYSFLVLFSLGVSKGKAGTLLAELLEFKRLYDLDASLDVALPRLAARGDGRYAGSSLQRLAADMHETFVASKVTSLVDAMYERLPSVAMSPADAYQALVRGDVEHVWLEDAVGRVSATMVAPYPPGIPVLMPGERIDGDSPIVDYLRVCESFDRSFPGFENEIHGLKVAGGRYRLQVLS